MARAEWEVTKPVEHLDGFKYTIYLPGSPTRINGWTKGPLSRAKAKIAKIVASLNKRREIYKYGRNQNVIKLYSV